jgi:hypothetical protein
LTHQRSALASPVDSQMSSVHCYRQHPVGRVPPHPHSVPPSPGIRGRRTDRSEPGFRDRNARAGTDFRRTRSPFPDEVARALADEDNLRRLAEVYDPFDRGLRDAWETIIGFVA